MSSFPEFHQRGMMDMITITLFSYKYFIVIIVVSITTIIILLMLNQHETLLVALRNMVSFETISELNDSIAPVQQVNSAPSHHSQSCTKHCFNISNASRSKPKFKSDPVNTDEWPSY